MSQETYQRATNYAKHVQWVIKTYDDAMGFVHGFQKDAIQNAVGARKNSRSFNGWKCVIDIVRTPKGTFLIVEDFGTVGLTGPNYTIRELDELTSTDTQIPADHRLARISVDNSSGGDSTSAGLFGVGKTLYAAASKDFFNYFESITENEGYRCNMNQNNRMWGKALEGQEGKNKIFEETGLEPIDHIGTRFIIVNPKDEIIEAIEGTDHSLLRYAEETWWRTIVKIPNINDGIFIGGKRAEVPSQYVFDEGGELNVKDSFFSNTPAAADETGQYRYKRIGFFIKDSIDEDLRGFYYYRRGMKIGKIDLSDYESQFNKPYFGFIELEDEWESELAKSENATHYDCERTGKNKTAYKTLKICVKKHIEELLEEWGYSKTKESKDKALKRMVEQIQSDLADILSENGYNEIGKGDRKAPIDIRLSDVSYPNENEPKYARSIYTDERLSFKFAVKNRLTRKAKIQFSIATVKPDNSVIKQIKLENIEIEPFESYDSSFVFKPDDDNSIVGEANGLLLVARLSNGSKQVVKKLIYYYRTETDVREDLDFSLHLDSFHFPDLPNKGRRVDTDEEISSVAYSMASRLGRPVKVSLKVAALDAGNGNQHIADLFQQTYTLPPFGEELVSDPFTIKFSKEIFYPHIRKGVITIRARLGLKENLPETRMTKGTVLDEYEFKVFFNKPEKSGPELNILPVQAPDRHKRSWVVETEKNTIAINISHPEFLACGEDLDAQADFILRQSIKESMVLYAQQGSFDSEFGEGIGNYEFFQKLEEKIEEIWYQQCQR